MTERDGGRVCRNHRKRKNGVQERVTEKVLNLVKF